LKPGRDVYERRTDASGRPFFWQVFQTPRDNMEGTDIQAFDEGYITLTPMTLDVTAPHSLKELYPLDKKSAAAAGGHE